MKVGSGGGGNGKYKDNQSEMQGGTLIHCVHTRRALKTNRKPFDRNCGGTVAPNLADK